MNKMTKASIYKHYRKSKNFFGSDNLNYLFNDKTILVHYHDFTTNWGDYINRFIIENLTEKKVVSAKRVYNWKKKELIFGIGSILQSDLSNSVIWGSGFVKPINKIKKKPLKILAVRGELTAEIFFKNDIETPQVYGDPALLFPDIYHPIQKKEFKLGIIPHYTEINYFLQNSDYFKSQNISVINPLVTDSDHFKFIDEILKCESIVSSSLHGLILADTYSIPSSRFIFYKNEIQGGDFKYNDYYSGVGITEFNTIKIKSLSPENFIDIEKETEKKILSFSKQKLINSLTSYVKGDSVNF